MLKFVYNTEAEIPEALKSYYKEVDGKWVLQVDGAKPEAEFTTMQTSLTAARDDVARYKGVIAKFGDHTPETISALQEENARLKVTGGDTDAQVEAMVEVRTKNLTRDLTAANQKTEQLTSELGTLRTESNRAKIEIAAVNAAQATGSVADSAMVDVKMHAAADLELNEAGQPVTKATCSLGAGLTPAQWLEKKLDAMPHWEAESTGGRSRGNKKHQQKGANPWKEESWNVTEQNKIYVEDPSRAKSLAEAAGVSLGI